MTGKNRIRRRVYDSRRRRAVDPDPERRRGVIRHFQEQMPHGLRMLLSARCLGHSPKFKKLANNKPFECRSAVFLSPSFRQTLEGLLLCGPSKLVP